MTKNLVLVVEPDADIRQLLYDRLEQGGYEVVEAATGEAALAIAFTVDLNGVVLEITLPGLPGLGVLDQLHRMDATLPIVMISTGQTFRRRALDRGAHAYFAKPLDLPLRRMFAHSFIRTGNGTRFPQPANGNVLNVCQSTPSHEAAKFQIEKLRYITLTHIGIKKGPAPQAHSILLGPPILKWRKLDSREEAPAHSGLRPKYPYRQALVSHTQRTNDRRLWHTTASPVDRVPGRPHTAVDSRNIGLATPN